MSAQLIEALRRADQFITNGIALGFIRMPDADTPDSAHQTPGLIRAALAAAEAQPAWRTDAQIVEQTEELAAALNDWRFGGQLTSGNYRDSINAKAHWCWLMACKAQEILTATDPANAAAELDGAAEAQPVADEPPFCWASPVLAEPDNSDEAQGWTARVSRNKEGVFTMPLYRRAAPVSQPVAVPQAARFMLVPMDDDGKASPVLCADEDAVSAALLPLMFFLMPGEVLSAEHADEFKANLENLLDSGCLNFEGDPSIYLYRLAAAPAAPALLPLTLEQMTELAGDAQSADWGEWWSDEDALEKYTRAVEARCGITGESA